MSPASSASATNVSFNPADLDPSIIRAAELGATNSINAASGPLINWSPIVRMMRARGRSIGKIGSCLEYTYSNEPDVPAEGRSSGET